MAEIPRICPCCYLSFSTIPGRIDLHCGNCDTLLTPTVDPAIYGSDYYHTYMEYSRSALNDDIQKSRWAAVLRQCSGGKLLDIGCGVGAFLQASPESFSVQGQDVNGFCVEHCKRNGLPVSESLPTELFAFDVITMFDVLEHIADLPGMIRQIRWLLKPRGYWVISTPNFHERRLADIDHWRHYKPNEHIYYLSETSIGGLCENYGFDLSEVNFDESKYRPPADNIATYVLSRDGDLGIGSGSLG